MQGGSAVLDCISSLYWVKNIDCILIDLCNNSTLQWSYFYVIRDFTDIGLQVFIFTVELFLYSF